MTLGLPNVVFLTMDAVRADRTSLCGYGRPTTPTLDRLAESGIVCEQAISTAAFTQPSLPSMLTSSMPLSFGGYDKGAVGRPPTIFKAFRDAGYQTTVVSTFPWVNRFNGYGDGIDREQHLFVINSLVGIASQTMASSLSAYHGRGISRDAMMGVVVPVVEKLFADLDAYCDLRMEQSAIDAADMAAERLLRDGYDYARIRRIVAHHRREFVRGPAVYIDRHLAEVPRAHQWIAADWRYARRLSALLVYGFDRLLAKILSAVAPERARLLEYRSKRYVDGHSLVNRIVRMLDGRDTSRPFFLWSHFFDTHIPYCPGAGRRWLSQAADYLRPLGYGRDVEPAVAVGPKPETEDGWRQWSALYDGAVYYTDEQIGRVVAALAERGLADDTWVVIAADHGEELGEHGDISHHFRMYEHNIRVPMLFHRPGATAKRIDALTTLMDLAPTVADLAGIVAPNGWAGKAVTAPAVSQREYVIAEAFHGGNCLFDHRPPYFAVRTRHHKYLWREYRDPTDHISHAGPELYDLLADSGEQNNIYRPDHPEVPAMNRRIAARLAEIPEISPERIAAAFGSFGAHATSRAGGRAAPA